MFTLPDLPYPYEALEPYIDEETMRLHHDKHHGTYVDKLNEALKDQSELSKMKVEDLLGNIVKVPEGSKQAVINHGGGHANHTFFWEIMTPGGAKEPTGKLADLISKTFGGFDEFKKQFTDKAMGVFGSGWAFLIMTPEKKLILKRHSFQNSPLMHGNLPVLGLDVWEHAYYILYRWNRKKYIDNWWNVINWNQVDVNFNRGLANFGQK